MKLCSFLRRNQFLWSFFGLVGLRGGGGANPLLQLLRQLCQTLPKPMHKLLTATEIIKASVFHCGRWSLSLSAAVQAPAQTLHYPAFSSCHYPPALSAAPRVLPPPELSLLTLLDYIWWHESDRQRGEPVTRKVDLSVFARVPV